MRIDAGEVDRQMQILLADDDVQVRSAMRLLLEHEPCTCVVGEVVDGESLVDSLTGNCLEKSDAEHQKSLTAKTKGKDFHLLLLDWELPGFDAVKQLPVLRTACPGLKVVALSVQTDARQIALAAGVDAFVSKSDPPDQVLAKLRALLS